MKSLLILCMTLFAGFSMAQGPAPKAVPVVNGQVAPAIVTQDINNNPVDLGAMSSQGKVLLTFFRYAGCPVCTYRAHELKKHYAQMKADGWEVIVVFESTPETLRRYQKEFDLPFVMIADPENKLFDLYAVERSTGKMLKTARNKEANRQFKAGKEMYSEKYKRDGKMNRIGADFVIGNRQRVIKAHYGAFIGDHLPIEEIRKN